MKPDNFIHLSRIPNLFFVILRVLVPPKSSQQLIGRMNRGVFILFDIIDSQNSPSTSIFLLDSYKKIQYGPFYHKYKNVALMTTENFRNMSFDPVIYPFSKLIVG